MKKNKIHIHAMNKRKITTTKKRRKEMCSNQIGKK
jgi:hypothetical protein